MSSEYDDLIMLAERRELESALAKAVRERDEARAHTSTAAFMRVERQRDEARADFANACDVGRRQEARAEKAERERDEARAQRDNLLDASKEGAWMARALDAERERDEACQKEREGCARICDLEFAANWHSAAMAAANAAKRCAELIRAADEPHTREPKENSQ